MGVKANIPLGVAIEGVKLAKGGVVSLVAPSEPPILKMNLVKFIMKPCPFVLHETSADGMLFAAAP
jgi:hypothetical protein